MKESSEANGKLQIQRKGCLLVDRGCNHVPDRHVFLGAKPSLALHFLLL